MLPFFSGTCTSGQIRVPCQERQRNCSGISAPPPPPLSMIRRFS